jgi:hypothetical protein
MKALLDAAPRRLMRMIVTGAVAALGAACAAEPPPLSVAISLGTRQCAAGGQQPEDLARRLRESGVQVLAQTCGSDGRMRPAMCGAADGRLAIFEIPAAQWAAAQALGYVRLDSMPDAQREPCR